MGHFSNSVSLTLHKNNIAYPSHIRGLSAHFFISRRQKTTFPLFKLPPKPKLIIQFYGSLTDIAFLCHLMQLNNTYYGVLFIFCHWFKENIWNILSVMKETLTCFYKRQQMSPTCGAQNSMRRSLRSKSHETTTSENFGFKIPRHTAHHIL